MPHPYDTGLDRNAANFQPLTPLTQLERAAHIWPDRTAVIHGDLHRNYADFYARSRQLASALTGAGIGKGDTVAALLLNTPPMLEAHYGVPMTGAVLNALNTRLDAAGIGFILDHGEAKLVIVDSELAPLLREALDLMTTAKPQVIEYTDPTVDVPASGIGTDYETFIAEGDPGFAWQMPGDEWDAISLNYTSGTTGNPKGVVYHHRGASLLATGNIVHAGLSEPMVYLWTLPMFHCNGWCFPWSVSVVGGTHVCLRQVRAEPMYRALSEHKVNLMCGAPIVMSVLLNAAEEERHPFDHKVRFLTAAAPPPEAVLAAMAEAGFDVVHLYGLTEVYGPAVLNEWKAEWSELPIAAQAAKKARQGVKYAALEGLDVMHPETMEPVPADGATMGEIMMRGNVVMKGYLKNPGANEAAFRGGWFHTGDLAVKHPDGYVQIRDRSKDVIISGGENISSIEVEDTLFKHPAVAHCAVVAKADEKWGETPCAFVELKPGKSATVEEIVGFCREHLAHYKCPRHVVFGELPKTSTGKIQKFTLRERTESI
ncbi:acyl-CoA synthetase [Rhodobacteraceae bacterium NNCM2]|nr:acyl-CoA synthetase [Coraliihabitans acroporae]